MLLLFDFKSFLLMRFQDRVELQDEGAVCTNDPVCLSVCLKRYSWCWKSEDPFALFIGVIVARKRLLIFFATASGKVACTVMQSSRKSSCCWRCCVVSSDMVTRSCVEIFFSWSVCPDYIQVTLFTHIGCIYLCSSTVGLYK